MKVHLRKMHCRKCCHEWSPRGEEVRICPKCRSAYWDRGGCEHFPEEKKEEPANVQ
jgi:Zn finger protein HypA/HybF involved in hydrogenase expression